MEPVGHSFPFSDPHLQLLKILFEFVTDCLASFRFAVKTAEAGYAEVSYAAGGIVEPVVPEIAFPCVFQRFSRRVLSSAAGLRVLVDHVFDCVVELEVLYESYGYFR